MVNTGSDCQHNCLYNTGNRCDNHGCNGCANDCLGLFIFILTRRKHINQTAIIGGIDLYWTRC